MIHETGLCIVCYWCLVVLIGMDALVVSTQLDLDGWGYSLLRQPGLTAVIHDERTTDLHSNEIYLGYLYLFKRDF